MTPLAPEPRHSVEALSFLYVCLGGRADGDYESSLDVHVPVVAFISKRRLTRSGVSDEASRF